MVSGPKELVDAKLRWFVFTNNNLNNVIYLGFSLALIRLALIQIWRLYFINIKLSVWKLKRLAQADLIKLRLAVWNMNGHSQTALEPYNIEWKKLTMLLP